MKSTTLAPSLRSPWPSLVAFLALTAAAAWAGSAYGPGPWYKSLAKPSFNPPNWIFPVVWTPLYVMIALAGWRLWVTHRRSMAMALWFVQLALNAAWTWLFFGQYAIGAALVDIVTLAATIGAIVVLAWNEARAAALLLIPYWAWVCFATVLNAGFWRLN